MGCSFQAFGSAALYRRESVSKCQRLVNYSQDGCHCMIERFWKDFDGLWQLNGSIMRVKAKSKEATMSKRIPATSGDSPSRSRDWVEEAKLIVAYPQDFGISRQDVRGLERVLGAIAAPRHHSAARAAAPAA